jgi:hypothetical protein
MEKSREIAKVIHKIKIRESKSDFAYWQTQPPVARIAALEQIRREYHGWHDETYPRLQRVYRVIKRS